MVATTIGSDLVVHGPTQDDSTREPGETFRILVTVQNLGAEWSTATTVRFYRSTDTTITTSATEVGTERVGPLRHLSGSGRNDSSDGAPRRRARTTTGLCGRGARGARHDEQLLEQGDAGRRL